MTIQTFDTRVRTPGEQISRGLASGLGGYLERLSQSKLKEIERQRVAQGLQGIGFPEEEAQGLSQLPPELQKEVVKDQYTTNRAMAKSSEKLRHDITLGERTANEQDRELKELERLEATGKIDSPLKVRAYRQLGLEHKLSPETQNFQKVAQGFLRGAKNIFGARVTDFDLKQYQQLFPSLMQSPEGRKQIIETIRRTNKAAKIRADAMREIIKANKNKIPFDFEDQIERRVGAELDQLAPSSIFGTSQSEGSDQLPDPAQYVGKKVRDTQTGQILQSNGSQWVPVG